MPSKTYYLACDLKDDKDLISKYIGYHTPENAIPEITKSIKDAGVENMEIYRTGNRLVMVMTVNETFSFEKKAKMDKQNPHVQEWEKKMNQFQQYLPWAEDGEKWLLLEKVFSLES